MASFRIVTIPFLDGIITFSPKTDGTVTREISLVSTRVLLSKVHTFSTTTVSSNGSSEFGLILSLPKKEQPATTKKILVNQKYFNTCLFFVSFKFLDGSVYSSQFSTDKFGHILITWIRIVKVQSS